MKQSMALLPLIFILVSCNDLTGTFLVEKEFKLKNTYTQDEDSIVSKDYGEVKVKPLFRGRSMRLALTRSDAYDFNIPKNAIPENGEFQITSAQSGQDVLLSGAVKTERVRTEIENAYVDCTYLRVEKVCTPQGCFDTSVSVYGKKWERRYFERTNQWLNMSILSNNAQDKLAKFSGDVSFTQKIVLSDGMCR